MAKKNVSIETRSLSELEAACSTAFADLRKAKNDNVLVSVLTAAQNKLTSELNAYNAKALEEKYDEFLSTDAPVSALLNARIWRKKVVRSVRMGGTSCEALTFTDDRLDVLDFIAVASDKGHTVADASKVASTLNALASSISELVKNKLANEEPTISTKDMKVKLDDVFNAIGGVESIHASSKDIRFLVAAATRLTKLRTIKVVDGKRLSTMLMDVYDAHLANKAYDVE